MIAAVFVALVVVAVGWSTVAYLRELTAVETDIEPEFDEHVEQTLALVSTLPSAPPQIFDPFIRSLPLSEAIYLLPDALAGEVEAWLAGDAL